MNIQFERPLLLLLLIPVIAGLILSYRFQNEKRKHVKIKQTILMGILFTSLVAAMSGPQVMAKSEKVATVFVVDASASVSDYREEMKQFINDALKNRSDKDYVGVVAFGGDAQVEQFVSEMNSFKGIQTEVDVNSTNLEQALSMAASMIPDGAFGRIILMTDGVENEGTVSRLSGTTLLSDKELLIYQIDPEENPEVYVTSINVGQGNQVSKGDRINILVNIKSNQKTVANVLLYQGRTLVDTQKITLSKGENSVLFTETAEEEGLATYTVRVEAESDTLQINNEYSTYLNITKEKKFLIVEDGSSSVEMLSVINSLYQDGKSHAEVVNVSSLPKKISDLLEYTAVIFVNVYAEDVPEEFMAILKSYVRDNGGGFIATGGRNSFGMGGYKDTVLEEILPVEMDPVETDELPSIAIYYVIDKSGSMGGGYGEVDKLEVAKTATVKSMETLVTGKDSVGVISFDEGITRVVDLHKIEDAEDLTAAQEKVASIQVEGGTSILPALTAAVSSLKSSDAKIKHIILLTDGEDGYEFSNYQTTLKNAIASGITITTVAVGDGCNTELLQDIASSGGGSCYTVGENDDLPKIFTQEILLHRKSYIRNTEFVPTKRLTSLDLLDGVTFDKTFKAYIATKLKSNAFELAYTYDEEEDEEYPILAAWQYGLGKTVAWTTDVTGEWSGNYSGDSNFAKMWANILNYVSTYETDSSVYAKVEVNGDTATVTYHTESGSASSDVEMTVTDSEGNEQVIQLTPIGINDYQATFYMDQPGAYMIGVKRYVDGTLVTTESASTVAMMQYSEEYRIESGAGEKVLTELKSLTGATDITDPEDAFKYVMRSSKGLKDVTPYLLIFAMVFFLYTIFYRRFRLDLIPEGTFAKLGQRISGTVSRAAKKSAEKSGEIARAVVSEEDVKPAETGKKPVEKIKKADKKADKKDSPKKNDQEILDTSQLLKRMKK